MSVTTRQTLIDYCLRKLGEPVIEINVDDDQVNDRIDDALEFYQEFHSDATKRVYVKHQVTQTDVDNGYIPINSSILFARRILPISTSGTSAGMFDLKYQMMLNDFAFMSTFMGDLAYYTQMKMHLATIDMTLTGLPQIEFVQNEGRLYIFGEFEDNDIQIGQWLVVDALQVIDPETFGSVYNDKWLKEYATALIKQQWGANLIKFEGMQLPGGVTMNGRQIFEDGNQEVEKLRADLRLEHELPVGFFVG